jgi:hypothetical protein
MLVSVYIVIYSAEWHALMVDPSTLGYFQRQCIEGRLRERWWSASTAAFVSRYLGTAGTQALPILLMLSGIALFTRAFLVGEATMLAFIPLILLIFINSTIAFGLDGADQMAVHVLFANAFATVSPKVDASLTLVLGAEVYLAYGVAGLVKLHSPPWRKGVAIKQILSSQSIGVSGARWLNDYELPIRFVCWAFIAFEILWLIYPLNSTVLLIAIGIAVIFHIVVALLMGLNLFPWAFASAYPFAYEASVRLGRHLSEF